uniref:Uncharacterized protein n=1 Tax=Romanomermis culicivorax TaxID=13658 RepID=A0A915LAH5_ROMCU
MYITLASCVRVRGVSYAQIHVAGASEKQRSVRGSNSRPSAYNADGTASIPQRYANKLDPLVRTTGTNTPISWANSSVSPKDEQIIDKITFFLAKREVYGRG